MGYIKIITAILIWSSLGIFVRKSGLTLISIIFYPAVIAGFLQFFLFLTSKQKYLSESIALQKGKTGGDFKNLGLLLLIPVCFVANSFFFYYAFTHTTIANAVLTHYTAPIFVAVLAPVFLKEKILKTTWAAIVLSSAGLWLILGGISVGGREWHGIMSGITSGLTYAFLILLIRGIASRYPALFIILIQNAFVVLILLPFIFKLHLTAAGQVLPVQAVPYVVFMGIVHSTIAPLLYVQGFRDVKANEAAILGYFEPVGAIIMALIFLNEIPDARALLGGALILYSGFIIIRKKTAADYPLPPAP